MTMGSIAVSALFELSVTFFRFLTAEDAKKAQRAQRDIVYSLCSLWLGISAGFRNEYKERLHSFELSVSRTEHG